MFEYIQQVNPQTRCTMASIAINRHETTGVYVHSEHTWVGKGLRQISCIPLDWGFPEWGYPQTWMVYKGKPMKIRMINGVPLFQETPI